MDQKIGLFQGLCRLFRKQAMLDGFVSDLMGPGFI